MAKANSPVRLNKSLMDEATTTARLFHRSAAEQVEYWADIGRRLGNVIAPDTLLSIAAGLATVRVEPVKTQPVDPAQVFDMLEKQRKSGALSSMISAGKVRYQASVQHPGFLERIDEQGDIVVGQFKEGFFTPKASGK